MSRTIEQKVVEMRFDNSNFEKNVSDSIDSLNKLQDSINKTSSGNAFADIGKAANNLNFSGLTASIQTVTESFSWMEEIAIGALRKIGENIEEHLVQALKHVTFDQIEAGFQRFSELTESTQTILSAIATEDYGDVNKLEYTEELLRKLAWFSDETSYNFTDMTGNIAKFTSAGLDLDASTTAMIGIANWAANAGQNAQTASRAMYQLSQAMGTGSIRLIDWKSIEVANMATKEVKELMLQYAALSKDSALKLDEAGYYYENVTKSGVERINVDTGNFRETLKYGWLTAGAFSDAMAEYASYSEALYKVIEKNPVDKEGGTMIATTLIKAFDEAIEKSKETGRSIEDIMLEDYQIDIMVDDGNGGLVSAIEGVTELGIRAMKSAQQARTWQQVIDAVTDAASTRWSFIFQDIFGNVEQATELFTNLAEFFYDVFVEPLNKLEAAFAKWKNIGGRDLLFDVDDTNETVSALENLEEALSVLLNTIGNGVAQVFPIFGLESEKLTDALSQKLLESTKKFRDWTGTLILSSDKSEKLSNIIAGVLKVFKRFGQIFGSVFGAAKRILGQLWDAFKEVFEGFGQSEAVKKVKEFFSNLGTSIIEIFSRLKLSDKALESFKKIFETVRKVIEAVAGAFGLLKDKIDESGASEKFQKIADAIGGKFMEVILWIPEKIADLVSKLVDFIQTSEVIPKVGEWFKDAVEFVKGFFDAMIPGEGIAGKLKTIIDAIKGFVDSLKETTIYKTAAEAISGFFKDTKDFFAEGNAYEKGVETFNNLKTAAENLGTTISEFGQKVWDGLQKAVDAIKKFLGIEDKAEENSNVGNDISKKGEGLGIGPVGNRSDGYVEALEDTSSAINIVRGQLENVSDEGITLTSAFEGFGEGLKEIITFVSQVLPGIGLGVAGFSLANAFGNISNGIEEFGYGFRKIGQALKKFGTAKEIKAIGSSVAKVIAAIALVLLSLAASAYVLDKVENTDKIGAVIDSFIKFFSTILDKMALLVFLGNIGGSLNIGSGILSYGGNSSTGLAALIAALALLVFAISLSAKQLSDAISQSESPDSIKTALDYVTEVIDSVSGALIALTLANNIGVGGNGLKGVALALIAAVVAVKLIVDLSLEFGKMSKNDMTVFNTGFEIVKKVGLCLAAFGLIVGASGSLKGAGAALLLSVGAIYLLSLVAKELGNLPDLTRFQNGVIMVGELGAILAAMMAIATVNGDGKGCAAAAAGMLVAVLAIAALALVVAGLSALQMDLSGGMITVVLLGVLLAALAAVFSGDSINAGKVAVVSAALLVADIAIGLLAAIVVVLSAISPESLTSARVTLEVMTILIMAIAYVFSNDSINAGKIAIVSASLLAAEIAIAALVAIVFLLASIPLEKLIQGGAATTVLGGLLIGLAAAFSIDFIKPGKIALVSAALLAMSVAMAALVLVLGMMAEMMTKYSWQTMLGSAGILAGFAAAMALIATVLSPSVPVILAIAGAIAILGVAAIEFAVAAQIVVNTLVTIAEKASVLEQDLARGIKAICNAIVEASPEITAAIGALLTDIIAGIALFFAGVWEKIAGFAAAFWPQISEFFTNLWTSVKDALASVWDAIVGFFTETIPELWKKGGELISNLWDGIKNAWTSAKEWIAGIWTSLVEGVAGIIKDIKDNGGKIIDNLWEGIKNAWNNVKQWVADTWQSIVDGVGDIKDKIKEKGGELIDKLWDGIKDTWNKVKTWIKGIWDKIIETIKNVFTGKGEEGSEGGGEGLGKKLIEGIKDGILATWERVKSAITGVANAVLKFFGIEWEIKSPSRAMMRMGEYLMEGAAIGIEDGEKEATDAATHAADSVTNAMASAINSIDDMLSDDFQPTITPVIDLSQIQNGAYQMGNLLDTYDNYTMRAAVAANYNPYVYPNGTLKVDTRSQMADSIANLENKFDEMLYKLGKIRVVLDSGTLVGELVDPMDEALGRKAVYVGRGM